MGTIRPNYIGLEMLLLPHLAYICIGLHTNHAKSKPGWVWLFFPPLMSITGNHHPSPSSCIIASYHRLLYVVILHTSGLGKQPVSVRLTLGSWVTTAMFICAAMITIIATTLHETQQLGHIYSDTLFLSLSHSHIQNEIKWEKKRS